MIHYSRCFYQNQNAAMLRNTPPPILRFQCETERSPITYLFARQNWDINSLIKFSGSNPIWAVAFPENLASAHKKVQSRSKTGHSDLDGRCVVPVQEADRKFLTSAKSCYYIAVLCYFYEKYVLHHWLYTSSFMSVNFRMNVLGIMGKKVIELSSWQRASHPIWDNPFWNWSLRFVSCVLTTFFGYAVMRQKLGSLEFLRVNCGKRNW